MQSPPAHLVLYSSVERAAKTSERTSRQAFFMKGEKGGKQANCDPTLAEGYPCSHSLANVRAYGSPIASRQVSRPFRSHTAASAQKGHGGNRPKALFHSSLSQLVKPRPRDPLTSKDTAPDAAARRSYWSRLMSLAEQAQKSDFGRDRAGEPRSSSSDAHWRQDDSATASGLIPPVQGSSTRKSTFGKKNSSAFRTALHGP